ncbi:MAG: tetratricopeptide repeat protein [Chitinophagaceae bacterium]
MKIQFSKATTAAEKVYWLDLLSRTMMNVSLEQADKYGKQLIEVAEESRDRKLMIKAYNSNGTRYGYFGGNKDNTNKSIGYFNQALDIAKENRMDEEIGLTMLNLAAATLAVPDKDKALSYINQAFSIISTLNNDSLKGAAHNAYGDAYLVGNDKILALRHYFSALRIGEDIHNMSLVRQSNINLSGFYSSIEDYDKAIDYYTTANQNLNEIKQKNTRYMRVIDMNSIGGLYAQKKSYDIAISYFERSLAIADSLKFPTIKIPAYVSLLNQYLRMDQPAKALTYFNSSAGQSLQKFLSDFGFAGVIDQAYAVIYAEIGKYDSAQFYFDRAAPFFLNSANPVSKMSYLAQQANLYKKTNQNDKAISMWLQVSDIAAKTSQLESTQKAAKELDSLYLKTGNFQFASQYNSIYYQYKDSVAKLNKEKELAQVEAADEQLRLEKSEKEKEEAKHKRFYLQYLAITIGITACFVALVILGMFKVSAGTIKMIGFFAFLMFFEFIFLIFKKNIYSITEGEPWKDLLFMIALAAILLPLHHWLEHKVIHYLTSHNRLTDAGKRLRMRLFNRKDSDS